MAKGVIMEKTIVSIPLVSALRIQKKNIAH
jgi:hypothetical protein